MVLTPAAHAAIDNADIFNDVLKRYADAASAWEAQIIGAASRLFWALATISMVWTFGIMALRKADIGDFFAEMVRFTVFTGFFWWILINAPEFSISIIDSLSQLAGEATTLGKELPPSSVVDVGFAIWDQVLDKSSIWQPVDTFIGVILALIILIILALIAVNMMLLIASAWILAYGGIFFLGFGGSRWTSDMAISYYKSVLGVAAQLMTMVLIIGIGKTFLDEYYANMSAGVDFREMGVMLIVVIILFSLVSKLPPVLAGIITGSGISGIGNHGAGSALGTVGMTAAAIATGGAAMAAGSSAAQGGNQALKAAFMKAGENVADGTDILSNQASAGGDSGDSGSGGSAGGSNSSPFSSAGGYAGGTMASSDDGDSSSNSVLQAVGNAGRIAADTVANLASGAGEVRAEKKSDRLANTTGGKIAAAIKGTGSANHHNATHQEPPTFDENSLGPSDSSESDPESEVAAFRDRDNSAAG